MYVVSQEHSFHSAMYDFGWKSIYLLLLCYFDHLVQISLIHCLVGSQLHSELESSALQHAKNWGILDPFKEADQLINFTLFDHSR